MDDRAYGRDASHVGYPCKYTLKALCGMRLGDEMARAFLVRANEDRQVRVLGFRGLR